jgi:hypothetical protein
MSKSGSSYRDKRSQTKAVKVKVQLTHSLAMRQINKRGTQSASEAEVTVFLIFMLPFQ